MKLSLALGPRRPLSRQTAWGCLTTNLAFPGFGSLLAGRKVGYWQIPFTVIGFGLTMLGGIPALLWGFSNWSLLHQDEDPMASLQLMWVHFRWPLAGAALFIIGILFALITSLSIMAEAREAEVRAPRPLPPKL